MRIEVPLLPPAELSPNSRCHWAERYRVSQVFHDAVYYSAMDTINRSFLDKPWPRPMKKARLNLTFIFAQGGRRDKDNLVGMFKPGLDALVKVRLIEDDDAKHLELGEVKVEVDKRRAPLTIVELEEIPRRRGGRDGA